LTDASSSVYVQVVDPVAGILDGPRAREAFLLRALLEPPWSLRVEDHAPLALVVTLRGEAVVVPDGEAPVALGAGDLAIVRGPEAYVLADDAATPPQVWVDEDEQCHGPDGTPTDGLDFLGVRTWGRRLDAPTALLIGVYSSVGEVSARLLRALPRTVVLRPPEWDRRLAEVLAEECAREAPGQAAVLDRLLDVVLLDALRGWLSRRDAHAPGWYRAQADPVVGTALRLLHEEPAAAWTLQRLAGACGVSRAALARRFTELVGEPPMSYLTDRRLALAADLLLEPGTTIGAVAQQVGYGSAFALSTAFKRVRGLSPAQHRVRARAPSDEIRRRNPS
jgi:AraC-like DNA-binding protein